MKIASALLAVAVLAAPTAAFAQVVDLESLKCGEFIKYSNDDLGVVMTWLDGYYKTDSDAPVIDFNKMKGVGEALGKECATNPDHSVAAAAEKVMGKRK